MASRGRHVSLRSRRDVDDAVTCSGGKHSDAAGSLASVNVQAATESVTNLALLPGFLDPVNLLNSFGTWVLVGLLLVVFIESGLLFPFCLAIPSSSPQG